MTAIEAGSFTPAIAGKSHRFQTDIARMSIEGGRRLKGFVRVSGAKNSVLKLMSAALLTPDVCIIRNVPHIGDVVQMIEVMRGLGANCQLSGDVLKIEAKHLQPHAPDAPVREMRASVQVMGPLLGRLGEAHVALPGGCAIGARPIDLHLAGLSKLNAEIEESHGSVHAKASRLTGNEIYLDFPSVGATENIMMAASVAQGETVIRNAAKEPEIIDLQNFINAMGGRIRGAGTDTVRIKGVSGPLHGAEYTVMPDRIEAGTWATMVASAGGDVTIGPVIGVHLQMIVGKLQEIGCQVDLTDDRLRVARTSDLKAVQIRSQVYPGFPTDMQPQFLALLAKANGTSIITETVYSSRYKHVDELRRMGAAVTVDGRVAVVRGGNRLTGAPVVASDLRAGAALAVAAVGAEGWTTIEGVHLIDRGYEDLGGKLNGIGGKVERNISTDAFVC